MSANGLVKDKESNERALFSAKQAHLGFGSPQEPCTFSLKDGCPPSACACLLFPPRPAPSKIPRPFLGGLKRCQAPAAGHPLALDAPCGPAAAPGAQQRRSQPEGPGKLGLKLRPHSHVTRSLGWEKLPWQAGKASKLGSCCDRN